MLILNTAVREDEYEKMHLVNTCVHVCSPLIRAAARDESPKCFFLLE